MTPEVRTETNSGSLATYGMEPAVPTNSGEPQIVLLHGFSQNGQCLGLLPQLLFENPALHLQDQPSVIRSVDLPGHGGSADYASANLWQSADKVVETCGRATYIGYSMGGRVAIHLALNHPGSVDSLVLVGATAGIEDEEERRVRRANDHQLADHIEAVGVERFTDEWLGQPLFADLPDSVRFEQERRLNTAEALAESLRNCGTGTMEPLWSRLSTIQCPVLVIAGELDSRYCQLGARMANEIGQNATFEAIQGAGHSAHLEQPRSTEDAIVRFLENNAVRPGRPG